MPKTLPLVLLLLFSTVSGLVSATDNIYIFEGDPLTICPLVFFSQAAPSFLLQPLSTKIGFLTGNYSYSGTGNMLNDFKFLVDIKRCETRRPSAISDENCSVLSVIYKAMDSVAVQGILDITYTSSGGDTQIITVNYGSRGFYISPPNRILQRQLGSMSHLDGSVIAYGQAPPAVLCINGSGQRLSANFITTSTIVGSCSRNVVQEDATNIDPGLFDIVIDQNIMGRHTVYAAAGSNCSNEIRSPPFEILLDPVTPPEGTTGMTFATPATTPTGRRLSDAEISIIAVVMGVVFVMVVIAIVVPLCVSFQRRRKKNRGVGSRTSSTSSADIDGGRPSPLIQGLRNASIRGQSHRKKLFIVKNDDSNHIKQIAESLHELNSDLQYTDVPIKNGKLPEFVAKVVKDEDRVIILREGGELHHKDTSQPEKLSVSRKWIHELEKPAAYTRKELRNVFLVLFGNNQDLDSLQKVSNLPRVPVSQCLDADNIDAASVAKIIQDQIEILLSKNEPDRSEGTSTPNLSTRYKNPSNDLKRKVNEEATPPAPLRVNHLKDQPGTSSASDMSVNSLTRLLESGFTGLQTEMQHGFEKMINETSKQGQMTRTVIKDEGQKIQEDLEVVHNTMEQREIDRENQHVGVLHPPTDDEQPASVCAPQINSNNNQEVHEGSSLRDSYPNLGDFLSHCGLHENDLESECPREVRDEIAWRLEDWKMLGRWLNFPPEKLTAIEVDNNTEEQRRVALLDEWSKKEGKGATYLKLAEALHRRQRRDLIQVLCDFKKHHDSVIQ